MHGRGLRQRDPLSLLLFILAIDPLQRLLDLATEQGALQKLRCRVAKITSLYADDATIFVAPVKEDLDALWTILHNFGQVTGLVTKNHKSSVLGIRCDNLDLQHVLQNFLATQTSFPMRYLGLPLSLAKMRSTDLQYIEDKAASKLAAWKGKLLSPVGRAILVKSILTSQVIYSLT